MIVDIFFVNSRQNTNPVERQDFVLDQYILPVRNDMCTQFE